GSRIVEEAVHGSGVQRSGEGMGALKSGAGAGEVKPIGSDEKGYTQFDM
ncbi:MAG: hypothetical protein INR71_03755, partial [Terriglobus roseus]|nr:hypothetical protein [Terriglobus roseus]